MALKPYIAILAAGQGKRMQSELPKVLHPVLFRPMIHHVLELANRLPNQGVSVIVGHGEEQVRSACQKFSDVEFVRQKEQKGTAHAVQQLESSLGSKKGHVLLLSGDVILLKKTSIESFLKAHEKAAACASLITTHLPSPAGYGRILKKGQQVVGIREEADASAEEKKITEINCGIYCFEISALFAALSKIKNKNAQGEFYLTDVIGLLTEQGKIVTSFTIEDAQETLGINDRVALADAEKILQTRINGEWMRKGATLQGPQTIYIDPATVLACDVTVGPGSILVNSRIGKGTLIDGYCRIEDSTIGEDCHIRQGSCVTQSKVGRATSVGPYAHLRPETILGDEVRIGNFVEVKKSRIATGSKASHLSYIGDAEIGRNVNIGCGFVTCNFDGVHKHQTIVEDGVFIGSDSQTVAPVKIGKGSYVASGTTVTEDVPPDSLVISRGVQVTKKGYAKRYQKEKKGKKK